MDAPADASDALTVYTLATCDTCRAAVRWLRAQRVEFTEKAIRETPPTLAELERMLALLGGDAQLRKLFNTSGQEYRALGLGAQLPTLSRAAALDLLAGNGRLVKRPFALSPQAGQVGFAEPAWAQAFGALRDTAGG